MVGREGLEPSSLTATDFKSAAYTNSATRPDGGAYEIRTRVKGFADLCLTPRPTRLVGAYAIASFWLFAKSFGLALCSSSNFAKYCTGSFAKLVKQEPEPFNYTRFTPYVLQVLSNNGIV